MHILDIKKVEQMDESTVGGRKNIDVRTRYTTVVSPIIFFNDDASTSYSQKRIGIESINPKSATS